MDFDNFSSEIRPKKFSFFQKTGIDEHYVSLNYEPEGRILNIILINSQKKVDKKYITYQQIRNDQLIYKTVEKSALPDFHILKCLKLM